MCDQTEVSYLDGDVVWVKCGPIFWPGVVKDLEKDDEGKEILAGLRKKPIAAVKFFQEDYYEFVNNLDQIYHYNCRRKDEFIKKGLDKFRTGASHMQKFPADVTTAEGFVNGDVNIINDPKFHPEEKANYSEIFGSAKKKNKKDKDSSITKTSHKPSKSTPYRPITHQRFINKVLHGESDFKVKTLIQPTTSPDDSSSRNKYKCHICRFETSRVNVIVDHNRLSHSTKNSVNWGGSDIKAVKRRPIHKARKSKTKKFSESFKDESSDDEIIEAKPKSPVKSPKKSKAEVKSHSKGIVLHSPVKSASASPRKRKANEESPSRAEEKKPKFTDVLLADWSEDEDDEGRKGKEEEEEEEKTEKKEEAEVELDFASDYEEVKKNEEDKKDPVPEERNQTEKMSCFDFEDEDDGFIGMSNANTYGRKIPRVIPVKDKTDLGVDLEIEELFRRKSESENEGNETEESFTKEDAENAANMEVDEDKKTDEGEKKNEADESAGNKEAEVAKVGRRGRRKSSKDQPEKKPLVDTESLALRRTRRPGSKKSYLNEVIEKIDEGEGDEMKKLHDEPEVSLPKEPQPKKKEESTPSRRKQDLKNIDKDRDEMIYTGMVKSDVKKVLEVEKKPKSKRNSDKSEDDLSLQIDHLLAETNLPSLPAVPSVPEEKSESFQESAPSTLNFSFDYIPSESPKKSGKTEKVKSINKMFSDSLPISDNSERKNDEEQNAEHAKVVTESVRGRDGQVFMQSIIKTSPVLSPHKKSPVIVTSVARTTAGQITALPIIKTSNSVGEKLLLPSGKTIDFKKVVTTQSTSHEAEGEGEIRSQPTQVKTIKIKPESLLASGKLKGQTIIHQALGQKYVLLPTSATRQKTSPGKTSSPNKVVILTNNQQKIVAARGLQQTKIQKMAGIESSPEKSSEASTSGVTKTSPIIKMVPDGKGGVMKKVTVTPTTKKVILGGKMLVSGGTAQGSGVQKFALQSGGCRLIQNYKNSGKTVLIQGSGASNVVLKQSTTPQQTTVSRVLQTPQNIVSLKNKPKIVMRTSSGHSEYVIHSSTPVDNPTILMKKKGADGKLTEQKIIRRQVVNKLPSSKTIYLTSDQIQSQKGESIILKTNQEPSKIVRLKPQVKEPEGKPKVVQKSPEVYTIPQSNIVMSSEAPEQPAEEIAQIVQIDQTQQPVLQTQVVAMPGPIGADGNPTYVLVSVDEHGVVQSVDNSQIIAYDASGQSDQVFVNPAQGNNVILINPQQSEEITPVYTTSSQDILAEALANTNVLEGSVNNDIEPVLPSILLPPAVPSSVVQETSITLQKPIMTPLEMPTSVAPDTSGLQPPPLPPTPTAEDVLMEECENVQIHNVEGEEEKREENELQEVENTGEQSFQVFEREKSANESVTEQTEEGEKEQECENQPPREDFLIENSQEEQNTNSFQSMPLLNDEPDTSDDAQGSEPIADQDFEMQKSRIENFTQLLREQEPPSSTNNEEANYEHVETRYESYVSPRHFEQTEQETAEESKDKEIGDNKDNQSMLVITDEGNANPYEMDPSYAEAISQKRFQEETEVTSTTDEYTNKDNV